jgi:hypothetical protein
MLNLRNSGGSVFKVCKITEIMLARRPLFKKGGVNKLLIKATLKIEHNFHFLFVDYK